MARSVRFATGGVKRRKSTSGGGVSRKKKTVQRKRFDISSPEVAARLKKILENNRKRLAIMYNNPYMTAAKLNKKPKRRQTPAKNGKRRSNKSKRGGAK